MVHKDLHSLSLAERVGQLFFIGIPGTSLDDTTEGLLAVVSPGGICLFSRNIKEARQTRDLLDALRDSVTGNPLLSLDQEGGLVDRLRRIVTPMAAANKVRSVADAQLMAEIIAEVIRILGFNMDFAPVVDVMDAGRSQFQNGINSRTFGNSAEDVMEMAGEFAATLARNGCLGSIKHFPGLGAATVDSHEELPTVNIDKEEFYAIDLAPYRTLIPRDDIGAVMVGHACYPKLDLQEKDQNGKLLPSSLSKNIVSGLLRTELGFDGLVITDDLEMGAIVKNYGIGEACKMAVLAGVDMLAICANGDAIRAGYEAVFKSVESGAISAERLDQSLVRIAAAKSRTDDPLPFNKIRLNELSTEIAEFNSHLNQI